MIEYTCLKLLATNTEILDKNAPNLEKLQRDFNCAKVEQRENILIGTYSATKTREEAIKRGRLNGKFYEYVRLNYPNLDSLTDRK